MGEYIISNAKSLSEAAAFLGEPQLTQTWEVVPEGIRFADENLTDEQCAALYEGFTPVLPDDVAYVAPLPEEISTHIQHLKDYLAADPTVITNAQTVHVVKDLIRAVRYLNRRLTDG